MPVCLCACCCSISLISQPPAKNLCLIKVFLSVFLLVTIYSGVTRHDEGKLVGLDTLSVRTSITNPRREYHPIVFCLCLLLLSLQILARPSFSSLILSDFSFSAAAITGSPHAQRQHLPLQSPTFRVPFYRPCVMTTFKPHFP